MGMNFLLLLTKERNATLCIITGLIRSQSQRLGGRLSARRQETVTGFLHLKLTSLKPKSTKSYFTIKLHILKQNSSNAYIKCPCVPQVLQAVARLSGSEMGPRLGTPAGYWDQDLCCHDLSQPGLLCSTPDLQNSGPPIKKKNENAAYGIWHQEMVNRLKNNSSETRTVCVNERILEEYQATGNQGHWGWISTLGRSELGANFYSVPFPPLRRFLW